jgi:hypothetical protein
MCARTFAIARSRVSTKGGDSWENKFLRTRRKLVCCLVGILTLGSIISAPCVSADPLYRTSSAKIANDDSYSLVAPYVVSVETSLFISITKPAASSSSTGSDTKAAPAKAAPPTITYGQLRKSPAGKWQVAYSVSCDLTNVLPKTDATITISGATISRTQPPQLNGLEKVISFDKYSIVVDAGDEPAQNPNPYKDGATITGATISDVSCPPTATDAVTVSVGVTSIPNRRAYLYLKKDAFFSDAISLGIDNNGMLSNSDSSSMQQITAILTELAQTAGAVLTGGGFKSETAAFEKAAPVVQTPRQRCFSALAEQAKPGPYYEVTTLGKVYDRQTGNYSWSIPLDDVDHGVALYFDLEPVRRSSGLAKFNKDIVINSVGQTRNVYWHDGFIAFFPVVTRATAYCVVDNNKGNPIYLAAPSTVSLYTESEFLDPQRDFFTNPQNTFTFNAGFITGHKYAAQSSAKTVVDTITQPIRALIPSVSVQQTTQVQTGGGKPDQTTSTTATTTSAPKGP